jgi:integrase/recombinase XerD
MGHKEVPVTHLRQMMLEELQRRNYAQNTAKSYVRIVRDFAQHFDTAPDLLGPDQIREYSAYLFKERKLEPATVEQHVAGLRFFYVKTLKLCQDPETSLYGGKLALSQAQPQVA